MAADIKTTPKAPAVSLDELLRRASALLPALKERSREADRLGKMPPATVDDLISADLIRMGTPERYGGLAYDFDAIFEVNMELGRACGSAAWNYAVWTMHNWHTPHFPEAVHEEYFGPNASILGASSYSPAGAKRWEAVNGGYRLSGRWEFSSGCDYADWVTVGAPGERGPLWVMVPKEDFRVLDDTWQVSGLRGTGSKDIVIEDAFVPAYRAAAITSLGYDEAPGWFLYGLPGYRLPLMAIIPYTLGSPLIGVARGAVDEFTRRLAGTRGRGRTADSVALQLRLAEAAAETDTARATLRADCRYLLATATAGERLDPLARARVHRNQAYVARVSIQAVNRLFDASGGHALFDSEPMQRLHRDAHAMAHHVALSWDGAAEAYGRAALGLPPAARW